MKMGDGLWLRTASKIFNEEYKNSGLEVENMIVDNMAMQLVSRPQQFDVMVMVSSSTSCLAMQEPKSALTC